jgi:outer membrane receptor for ferric coprogen and ferric-rhodotorulic acid
MSWNSCSALPDDSENYLKAFKVYKDHTNLKILLERDNLTEKYYASKEKNRNEETGAPSTGAFSLA